MNSETEKPDHEFRVSSMSHKFRLEWKISLKAFLDSEYTHREMPKSLKPPQMSSQLTFVENSKLFDFKDLKIRPFYLELYWYGGEYALRVVTQQPTEGAKLDYAFVSIKDRLYYIHISNADNSPAFVKGRKLTPQIVEFYNTENDVKVVCGISAPSEVQFKGETGPEEHIVILESSLVQSLPTWGDKVWPRSTSEEVFKAVTRYSLSGELPCLSVELARDLLSHLSDKNDHAVLKSFCVEYLMENLTPENVVSIWRLAGDHNVKDLVSKCHDYVSENCSVTKKKQNDDDL